MNIDSFIDELNKLSNAMPNQNIGITQAPAPNKPKSSIPGIPPMPQMTPDTSIKINNSNPALALGQQKGMQG